VGGAFAVRSRVQQAAGTGSRHSALGARAAACTRTRRGTRSQTTATVQPCPCPSMSCPSMAAAHERTWNEAEQHPASSIAILQPLPCLCPCACSLFRVSRHLAVTVP
jgi:hypothetical protein